jgi:alkanesulfonate monooxygenase
MRLDAGDGTIQVFSTAPRVPDASQSWKSTQRVIEWSDRYGCTGILIFTGNDTHIDPWLTAQVVLQTTATLSPLVAVNPIYMHPFTAAKMVSSLGWLYARKVYLNLVTGTALNYLQALHGELTHDERYERLTEYATIVRSLLADQGLTTFHGRFFQVSNLQLRPRLPRELLPDLLLAGQSPAARRTSAAVGGAWLQMLQPNLERGLEGARAVHFGIITRPTNAEAWGAAQSLFPENRDDQQVLEYSMTNTDSVWKHRMKAIADGTGPAAPGYWLAPFRNFQADCPFFVGDHEQVAALVRALIASGIDRFVLEIPPAEEEFANIAAAFDLAYRGVPT